ncbi:MAG: hypothetical protein ACPGVG_08750 [Mycobacterium sp.]
MSDLVDGDCYEAAVHFLMMPAPLRHPEGAECPFDAVLVHGRPTLQREPYEPFGHAWVEYEHPAIPGLWIVRDVSNGRDLEMPAPFYYQLGKIDPAECFRYTRSEVHDWLESHKHYGPWEGPEGEPPVSAND